MSVTLEEIAAALDAAAGFGPGASAPGPGPRPGRLVLPELTETDIAAALDAVADIRPVPLARGWAPSRRPLPRSWAEAFLRRTVALDGGHRRWIGRTDHGTPYLTFHQWSRSAYRVAFELHYGRPPQGPVLPTCGLRGCMSGGHLADTVVRLQTAAGTRP